MAVIAIDGRKYFDFGIGTYIRQLVRSLALLETSHTFILYADPADISSVRVPDGWMISAAPYRKYSMAEIGRFGYRARGDGIDLFHEPHYTLPAGLQRRSIVTIHDVIHLRFPGSFNLAQRFYSQLMIRHALNHAGAVIVDSEFTKNDILGTFAVDRARVHVVPLGVGEQYVPLKGRKRIEEFRKRFGIGRKYVLYVGNVKVHKGIDTLLEAFRILETRIDHELVMVGGSLRNDTSLVAKVSEYGLQHRVKELGNLTDEDLVTAYNGAEMLVMPSRYEGFGLPALEAMACDTPVVVSNAGSLPEVVGDAAMMFDAGRAEDLAGAILTLSKSPQLRKRLTQKGRKQAKKFTWHETAARTLALYEQVLDSTKR